MTKGIACWQVLANVTKYLTIRVIKYLLIFDNFRTAASMIDRIHHSQGQQISDNLNSQILANVWLHFLIFDNVGYQIFDG